MKKIIKCLISIAVLLALVPFNIVFADTINYLSPIYVDGDPKKGLSGWETKSVPNESTIVSSSTFSDQTKSIDVYNTSWLVVEGTLQIRSIETSNGVNCNIVLKDNSKITLYNGIVLGTGSTLNIYAQSTGNSMGEIVAYGQSRNENAYASAAIGGTGGTHGDNGPKIIINGGKITATGADSNNGGSAGIGSGVNGSIGDIIINDGEINATGGRGSAGIGFGNIWDYDGANYSSTTGDIIINGGTINATGNDGGSGIGSGSSDKDLNLDNRQIIINNGTIQATSNISSSQNHTGKGIACGSNPRQAIASTDWNIKINKDLLIKAGADSSSSSLVSSDGTSNMSSELYEKTFALIKPDIKIVPDSNNAEVKYGDVKELNYIVSSSVRTLNSSGMYEYANSFDIKWYKDQDASNPVTNTNIFFTSYDSESHTLSIETTATANSGSYYFTLKDKNGNTESLVHELKITNSQTQNPPTGLSATDETIYGKNDGKISNVTSEMEYKLSTADNYTSITGTEVGGLAAGTYYVRYKEKINYFPSNNVEVIISHGNKLTVTFDGNGHTFDSAISSQEISYNGKATKPSDPSTTGGYYFSKWYKEQECTNEWDFNTEEVTSNTTIYAKWKKKPAASDFTFTPPENSYYENKDKPAKVTSNVSGMGNISIQYHIIGTDITYNVPPKALGEYKVYINVSEGTDYFAGDLITDPTWTFEITKLPITIVTATNQKTYDGTPLSDKNYTASKDLPVKCTIENIISSEITQVGTCKNIWSKYMYFAGYDASFCIDTTFEYGDLTITPITTPITITANSAEKEYDGKPLVNNGFTYTDDILVNGDTLSAVVEGTITNVGSVKNVVKSYKVTNANGVDVTNCYTFNSCVDGTLTINKKSGGITLSAPDSSKCTKKYDGKPFAEVKPNMSDENGTELFYSIDGNNWSKTFPTSIVDANTYTVYAKATNNNYVTTESNSISYDLTITKRSLILSGASDSKVYDGTPLTNSRVIITGDGFVKGEGFSVCSASGSITNIGYTNNRVDWYEYNSETTKESNYIIDKEIPGTLSITGTKDDKINVDIESLRKALNQKFEDMEYLDVTSSLFDISKDDVDESDIDIIKQNITSKHMIKMNIDIFATFNYEGQTKLAGFESPELITFSHVLDLNKYANVSVGRVHHIYEFDDDLGKDVEVDKEFKELTTTPDKEPGEYIELDKKNNKVIIHAKKYSTYAICYDEIIQISATSKTKTYDGQPLYGEATVDVTEGTTITYQTKTSADGTYGTATTTIPNITNPGKLYVKATATNPDYISSSVEYVLTINEKSSSKTNSSTDYKTVKTCVD